MFTAGSITLELTCLVAKSLKHKNNIAGLSLRAMRAYLDSGKNIATFRSGQKIVRILLIAETFRKGLLKNDLSSGAKDLSSMNDKKFPADY